MDAPIIPTPATSLEAAVEMHQDVATPCFELHPIKIHRVWCGLTCRLYESSPASGRRRLGIQAGRSSMRGNDISPSDCPGHWPRPLFYGCKEPVSRVTRFFLIGASPNPVGGTDTRS